MRRALWFLLLASSSCSVPWEPPGPGENKCTRCHGDATRGGDPLVQAAPPNNLAGNDNPATPGVGAHLIHLEASATHGAVACAECHLVPERTGSPGHDDTPGPAEITFGALASQAGHAPSYDGVRRTCGDTYCHGPGPTQGWTRPRSAAAACGTCHGLPPPLPHPQSQACEQCHGAVVGPGRQIITPALHVDGVLQVVKAECNACHGNAASPAPPRALDGGTAIDQPGVGAHTAHLGGSATTRPVRCEECHLVPAKVDDPGHLNGGPAEVRLSGVATGPDGGGAASYAAGLRTCTTWCHSAGQPDAGSPVWTRSGAPLPCTGCHGLPPPPPHPAASRCSMCHPNATGPLGQSIDVAALHVNGRVEVSVPANCDGCHGSSANPAPPRDTQGNTATNLRTVGAHQAHLVGTGFSRRPLCGECHVVPAATLSAGHVDGVTQVVFSGVALTAGSTPTYTAGTCANAWCHDTRPLLGAGSNGGLFQTPSWTRLDGEQVKCNACHGNPPAPPHPQQTDCSTCHPTMGTGSTFVFPLRHIDGKLDVIQ